MKKSKKNTKAPAPAKSTVKAPKKTSAPAVKKTASKTVTTFITAQIDVGFGNSLYIRGEGPGLSWGKGLLMTCVSDNRWAITLPQASQPFLCKFLLNDLIWSNGADYVLPPGRNASVVPMF